MATRTLVGALQIFLSLILSCSPIALGAVLGKHNHHILEDGNLEKRQALTSPVFPVLGVRGLGVDTIHPRLEIRELERNQDQLNVYLLGLRRLQNLSQDDKLSYFQVAGIHGRPLISWDGVAKHPAGKEGYCAHGSNLFPTWHRPYLALIEELIYLNAREAISEFHGSAKERMYNALQTFRIPYWDAAAIPPTNTSSYPSIVQAKTITVEIPNGNTTTKAMIPNPLYAYTFHPMPTQDFEDPRSEVWKNWASTKRYPSNKRSNASSQDNAVGKELDSNRENLMQRTYYMLSMQKDYHNISNNNVDSRFSGGVLESLESVHDTLHNTIGHGGHMWYAAYSAFDPVFWLVHANTDRLLAIWQALNPESYVTYHKNPDATFTTPAKSFADENTPLHPFHRTSAGDFWTSAHVRDHTIFGYTYPELTNLSSTNTLIQRVNSLYGENATPQFSLPDVLKLDSPQRDSNPSGHSTSIAQYQYQYFANIRARNNNPEGAIRVYVFFNNPNEIIVQESSDTLNWSTHPGFVGYTGFQNAGTPGTGTAQDAARETNGVIALTKALEERVKIGELESLDESVVGAFLQERMEWRIVAADDKLIAPEQASGFEIRVSWAKVTASTLDTFPEVKEGGFKNLLHATCGKAGGG